MPDPLFLLHLGDLRLTIPAALAMSAALLARRAWLVAVCWIVLFGLGFGVVGASKIAFMGWGGGWPALCYKALSGHATGASAVLPALAYLLLQERSAPLRRAGIAVGIGLGMLVSIQLVQAGEHSALEACAGFLIGSATGLAAIGLASSLPPPRPLPTLLSFALTFIATAWAMRSAHVGYWMVRLARLLSGNDTLHVLTHV